MSKTIVVNCDTVSRKLLPLTRTPILEAAPIPPKKPSGTDMTRAHGQDTIKKIQARLIHSLKPPPNITGGIIANRAAPIVTTGV